MPRVHRQYGSPQSYQIARSSSSSLGGKIMWLPKREQLDLELGIDEDCYGHPVVILSVVEGGKVVVSNITSLNGRALRECRWARNVRDGHLPIHPCEPHPDNGKLLYLQHDEELPKKSYVNTLRKLTIPLYCLQTFHGRRGLDCYLTAASYEELLEYARYVPTLPSQGHGGSLDRRRGFQAAYPGTPGPTEPLVTVTATSRPNGRNSQAYSDYERQIRFNTAAQARNLRPYARRSTGYQTFPIGDGSRDRGPNFGRILLFVATTCVWVGLFYAGYRGILKIAELVGNAWQWLKDGIKSIWSGKLYMARGV